ncbi:MAG: hypothetical protein H7Y27_01555 [Gemmatimonadaceae bacterium]|nr:hypothetical protein [Chitinophagaceae bacterium]
MERNKMYYDVRQSMIHRKAYRPSSNLTRFARFLWTIIVMGESPIHHRASYERRVK